MIVENALAAGQGGNASAAHSPPDETSAVGIVTALLASSMALFSRCEAQANAVRGDLGPVYAASQLLHASANLAKALAAMGCGERRSRTIVERIQPPAPHPGELNCGSPRGGSRRYEEMSVEEADELRANLERRLDEHLEATRALEEQEQDAAIACCI